MGLSIKNSEVEGLARELAALEGASITDAIRTALRETLNARRKAAADRIAADLAAIAEISARHRPATPIDWAAIEDEIYDEIGAPR